jgi:hypothetical protein
MEMSMAPPSFPPPSPTLKPYGSRLALGYWWAHSLIIHMFKRSVAAPGALRRAQCARASSARERGSTVSITSKRALGSTDFFFAHLCVCDTIEHSPSLARPLQLGF